MTAEPVTPDDLWRCQCNSCNAARGHGAAAALSAARVDLARAHKENERLKSELNIAEHDYQLLKACNVVYRTDY